ncbi:amphi-Trp domain-containing protein [Nitrincola tapanii]|uniref:Amphi-Trp domain-containing protein n=1 Tax=Nitrincola tapanii TaxID=1708751 RepID=A0A5A9VYV5_9GAMM|nr:amphi-Trp domain-containing protein [Nitrincola tapanii]KAA0873717.1 amphi-Trp domain-containing protein [Nitrincola tapanii]
MAKKKSFRHQSLQETAQVRALLQALIDGLDKGQIRLEDEQGKIRLKPNGLLNLSIAAEKECGISKLGLKISWRDEDSEKASKPESLKID